MTRPRFGEAKKALERGETVHDRDDWGSTPLHLAVEHNRADLVRLYLAHGADVNAVTFNGYPVIGQCKDPKILHLLAVHGADVQYIHSDVNYGWVIKDMTLLDLHIPFYDVYPIDTMIDVGMDTRTGPRYVFPFLPNT